MKRDYNPLTDGVLLFNESELIKRWESTEAYGVLKRIVKNRPGNLLQEVNTYRKHVPLLLNYVQQMSKLAMAAAYQAERVTTDNNDKKYQRWSAEEEELLIELVCREDISMLELSTTMGRTVPAIKTKLSNLVGVKRLSQKVVGKFIGTLNGNQTEANIAGIVYKEEAV